MSLIYPIGLLALAALIIPLLIHLWSVKQGKTLKIGSIALLGENATTSSKSLKLTDLLLFLLRCLLLILIAFMLAQPLLKNSSSTTKNKGWILIDKAQFSEVYTSHQNTIDSLLTIGFELHDFNIGFTQFSLKDSVSANEFPSELKYNSLLNQLNKEIPFGYSAYLFADRRLSNFEGNLPELSFNLIWKDVANQDTSKSWSTTFLNKVYQAKSTPRFTNYSAYPLQNLQVIKVMIYDPIGVDSKYIKAGLNAIADFTKRKIEIIKSYTEADVVFWLSDQPHRSSDEQRVFSYQKGKLEVVNSTLQIANEPNENIMLKKRIVFDNKQGRVIWKDGYGKPILIKESKRNHFYFYSRFDPQFTDLVWDEQFVKALLPIVLGVQSEADFGFEDHDADQRLVAKTQFLKSKLDTSSFSAKSTYQSIEYIIWILAFVTLIIERILSFRNKNRGYAKS